MLRRFLKCLIWFHISLKIEILENNWWNVDENSNATWERLLILFYDSCCCDNMCSMKEQCSANTKVHKTKFGYILAHSELKVLNSPKAWKLA